MTEQQWQFLLYNNGKDRIRAQVMLEWDTVWMSQKSIAELFEVQKSTLSEHFSNIFAEWELEKDATVRNFRTVQIEWEREVERNIDYYNLDAIISVGYRVSSKKATQFRIWATSVLKEYLIKGFVLDDERLSQGKELFWKDYFKELLERVRSIRASERRMYLQITDIFAECCVDYDRTSQQAKDFYAMMQNKFHYAITGKTAAEIIYSQADKDETHMWLQSFKNAPDGRVIQSDVTVAKNYLSSDDLKKLERAISWFFDYIERVIENNTTLTMLEFAKSVDKFLGFNEYKILEWRWKISSEQAKNKALEEYKEFNKTQKITSDFEKLLEASKKLPE